jgi:hypothetical protein
LFRLSIFRLSFNLFSSAPSHMMGGVAMVGPCSSEALPVVGVGA